MVQRLAPEKGTMRCLEALASMPVSSGGMPRSLDGKRPVHLAIAGDGPSRRALEKYAVKHQLPVTFVGNLPNKDLPPLYRSADLFVTCSTSETYGLTVLEALACGTPVVLPHCGVFDELWVGKVPPEWIYDEAVDGSLLKALRVGGHSSAKAYLEANPIKQKTPVSWEDAAHELMRQYEEAIEANLPRRQALAGYVSAADHLMRAALVVFFAWWCFRAYTNKILGMTSLDEILMHKLLVMLGFTPDEPPPRNKLFGLF
jgi:glycosyltransferase involved in cell wall biosynthesis